MKESGIRAVMSRRLPFGNRPRKPGARGCSTRTSSCTLRPEHPGTAFQALGTSSYWGGFRRTMALDVARARPGLRRRGRLPRGGPVQRLGLRAGPRRDLRLAVDQGLSCVAALACWWPRARHVRVAARPCAARPRPPERPRAGRVARAPPRGPAASGRSRPSRPRSSRAEATSGRTALVRRARGATGCSMRFSTCRESWRSRLRWRARRRRPRVREDRDRAGWRSSSSWLRLA